MHKSQTHLKVLSFTISTCFGMSVSSSGSSCTKFKTCYNKINDTCNTHCTKVHFLQLAALLDGQDVKHQATPLPLPHPPNTVVQVGPWQYISVAGSVPQTRTPHSSFSRKKSSRCCNAQKNLSVVMEQCCITMEWLWMDWEIQKWLNKHQAWGTSRTSHWRKWCMHGTLSAQNDLF
jgi:hypothetical protein